MCEPLGGTEGLIKAVGLRRRRKECGEEQVQMSTGTEFQTEGAATLKPWEANYLYDYYFYHYYF